MSTDDPNNQKNNEQAALNNGDQSLEDESMATESSHTSKEQKPEPDPFSPNENSEPQADADESKSHAPLTESAEQPVADSGVEDADNTQTDDTTEQLGDEASFEDFLASSEELLEELVDPEWEKTLERLGLEEADVTGVSINDILYLAKQWAFLQVIDSGGDQEPLDTPERIKAQSGWTILYYGDAMAASPGRYIFGRGYVPYNEDDDDDDEGGGGVLLGKGTIVKQAFDTACEIMQIAQERGWKGVQVVDGHPDMQRAAWMEAVRIGMRFEGYTPDVPAELVRRRIAMSAAEMDNIRREVMTFGSGSS